MRLNSEELSHRLLCPSPAGLIGQRIWKQAKLVLGLQSILSRQNPNACQPPCHERPATGLDGSHGSHPVRIRDSFRPELWASAR